MATMVKEKRRPKTKSKKGKPTNESPLEADVSLQEPEFTLPADIQVEDIKNIEQNERDSDIEDELPPPEEIPTTSIDVQNFPDVEQKTERLIERVRDITIDSTSPSQEINHVANSQINPENNLTEQSNLISSEEATAIPSAPIFNEPQIITDTPIQQYQVPSNILKAVPLEEAVRVFCEREIENIKAMSEKEEALVQAGPISSPEHPLVDLLSTFKRSLAAVERVRNAITCAVYEEEKFRQTLWHVTKREDNVSQPCPCGATVYLKLRFEVAELKRDNLPVARRKLDNILREVQENYCHHQHSALLSHCQIEDLLVEIMHGNMPDIREALALILQALRFSDTGPPALAVALTRWATALSTALNTARDMRQLLFLIHHLFRQSRSVRWATSAIRMSCNDTIEASRVIMLLDLLLNKPRFEAAKECTEELSEDWEEVDKKGGTGAVAEGSLRERDLLALIAAFPLRDLAARLLTCDKADVTTISEHDLIDPYGGYNILKCCYGTRTLIAVIHRAVSTNSNYGQLRNELTLMAAKLAEGLAQIHLYMLNSNSYKPQISLQVSAELDDIFSTLRDMLFPDKLDLLPTSLMTEENAMKYCNELIAQLHSPLLSCAASPLCCGVCVRAVCSASCARASDHNLSSTVLHFLMLNGLCKKAHPCKFGCESVSRECIAKLLESHPYMQTIALHMLADLSQTSAIDPTYLSSMCLDRWRPQATEVSAVLQLLARSCPQVLEHLLMQLEYTPNVGLCLEAQLSIGSFLVNWLPQGTPTAPNWPWAVLRKLRPHRTSWNLSLDVPPPEMEEGLFAIAYALLSSSWGHCIPLICTTGVSALIKLALSRPEIAVHCLSTVMMVMQHSPESVSLTKQFGELFDILLTTGPTFVQRALGVGKPSGAQLLQEAVLEQLSNHRYGDKSSLLLAWLHGLCRSEAGLVLADAAVRSTRCWTVVDHFFNQRMQEASGSALVTLALSSAASAPLLSECALRALLSQQLGLLDRVHTVLLGQRRNGEKINVDKALKQVGSAVAAEQLCVFAAASGVLAAPPPPPPHPALLLLARALLHLWLQRPHGNESTPPVGPLYFSGYYKSRVLSQIKKRLQEYITYHQNQYQIFHKKCQSHPRNQPLPTNRRRNVTVNRDVNILPSVSIEYLTGDSDESDSEDERERDSEQVADTSEVDRLRCDEKEMMNYHAAAEKMLREYARWLEEGEQTRALPSHADIARFIPEVALDTAWRMSLKIVPKQEPIPSIPFPQQRTHVEILKDALMSIKTTRKRRRPIALRSTLEDAEVTDPRTLLNLVVKHLSHLENLARELSMEANYITTLDNQLMQLVCSLRVPKSLPPKMQRCQNNCKPITLVFPVQEWCVCENTERAIIENRSSAVSAMKKLARPRTHSVNTVAALHTLARQVSSAACARQVLQAAYSSAARLQHAAPAQRLVADLVTDLVRGLAETWITHDGPLCSEILKSWCKTTNSLQQQCCLALVDPRRLNQDHWLTVYLTVARSNLPVHVIFSLLSKFDVSRWSDTATDSQRWSVLEALIQLVQTWGPQPPTDTHILLELCGVQCSWCARGPQLCGAVPGCARAAAHRSLPPAFLPHLTDLCARTGPTVGMDELGYLLRELGMIWWEARTSKKEGTDYTLYAVPMAQLLTVLQRAFVAAAIKMSYEPERVGEYAWSSSQEAWSPWVTPPTFPPLLDSAHPASSQMLRMFTDTIAQVMVDCPGTETLLLRHVFCWLVQLRLNCGQQQQGRILVSELMQAAADLPWNQYPWIDDRCVQAALLVVNSSDAELKSWSASCWRDISAECWLAGCQDVVPRLVALLHIFTADISISDQVVSACGSFPWWRLPAPALEAALSHYYITHYHVAEPYHTNTQFTVLLYACGLISPPTIKAGSHSALQESREMFVSHYVRVMCDSTLIAHVADGQKCLLHVIENLASTLDPGSLQSVLSRAAPIMCIEPAAAAAAPVWVSWLGSVSKPLLEASLSALCSLTSLDYFAIVGEAAVKAYMNLPDSSWAALRSRLSPAWAPSTELLRRGAAHCAHVVHTQSAHAHHRELREALLQLRNSPIHVAQNEVIIAVHICYACRIASEYINSEDAEKQDCLAAANVLMTWADEKKSLLSTLGLQGQKNAPTDKIRLLCRLAQCILNPNNESFVRAYESCCPTVLGTGAGDVTTWGRQPHPTKLVRLAMRLFPNQNRYFQDELDMLT